MKTKELRSTRVRTSEEAAAMFDWIRTENREHFVALYLDARGHVLKRETISIGTATQCLIHPREVFSPAIEVRAVALIVAHNHPSGDPTPSHDDRAATARLRAAGELLGIEMLDHLILVPGGFFSFREAGFPPSSRVGRDALRAV